MQKPSAPTSASSELDSISMQMLNDEPSSTSPWDWNDFLDLDILSPVADHPPPPTSVPPVLPITQSDSSVNNSGKVRKRDPRLTCSNFLAGRIPCVCPELDAILADEEEEEMGPGKKRARARAVRAVSVSFICQVPGCGADISELKWYHRRHRVCLRCATASTVVLNGETKRYCQQCGKFHILSDFDEGKRSCRWKLERHNDIRRRKSTDSKGLIGREPQQVLLAEDVVCDDEIGKDTVCLNSEATEGERLLDAEGNISILCSDPVSQNTQSDSGVSVGASRASGETKRDDEKEKCTQSPSYCKNKTAFSSACPTRRISFKLYDWNPAEFPRRLRHQIFQWLASMPVELEGYIRPGCTILTVFIAMPNLMWVKLFEDPFVCIHNLIVAPGNMLFGKGSFHVYLNNMVFRVMKDGTSVVKVLVEKQAPKLHYVHPTCFEAGKPMEFVICGSYLLQPKFRFLVSFAGEYTYDVCVSPLFNETEEDAASGSDHQLLKICVPHTETNIFGPAFIEVENESGLSNFLPILIGHKEICSEMNIMQHKLDISVYSKRSQVAATCSSCDVSVLRQKYFSEFIVDVAWILKEPALENKQQILTSSHIQRFNCLLNFLIENESSAVLERVAYYVKIVMNNSVTVGVADADMELYQRNVDRVSSILCQKFQKEVNSAVHVRNIVFPVPVTKQGTVAEKHKLGPSVASPSLDRSETLLNAEVVMSVKLLNEQQRKSSSRLFTNTVLTSRPLLFVISAAAACFGICAVVLHPQKVGEIAVSIRRCLFDHS